MHVWMTAAHAGYGSEQVPVGGAAAVCERLCAAWSGRDDVDVTLLGPGPRAPAGTRYERIPLLDRPPSAIGELRYARFCRDFERAVTRRVLDGPSERSWARAGRRVVALVHVDVVEYFARIYLGGLIGAPRLARAADRLRRLPLVPDVLRLVFDKQAAAARHASHLVVPSAGMKDVLAECYPDLPEDRVVVLPWGGQDEAPAATVEDRQRLRREWALPEGAPVLLTLSRISPEKGQDLLLRAVAEGERRGEVPDGLRVVICGEAAYMRGPSFHRRLREQAARLRTPTVFPGHLGGTAKHAALDLATVFVSPSRHESYGLTTMEALSHGLPVVGLRTHGLEAAVDADCGILADPGPDAPRDLWRHLRRVLADQRLRARMRDAACRRAASHPFSRTAERLLDLLRIPNTES